MQYDKKNNYYMFQSIKERDDFFIKSPELLQNKMLVSVCIDNITRQFYEWHGRQSPDFYFESGWGKPREGSTLFRIGISPPPKQLSETECYHINKDLYPVGDKIKDLEKRISDLETKLENVIKDNIKALTNLNELQQLLGKNGIYPED